jgi:ATP-dependent DNA helicase RecQ
VSRRDEIRRAARERFGYAELRPGQTEVIEAVLAGRDSLAVMSTGYGKSAIYQIAAVLLEGPTVVVSPLIALQRDQVEDLDREAVGGAAAVSSRVSEQDRREALSDVRHDGLEFLFLAPEQFAKPEVLAQVAAARPSLLVVDEAHCISEWGHDFRPDYLRLGAVAEEIGRPTILALTATASPPIRDEIVERLRLRDPLVHVRGFERENLWLGVERFRDERRKREAFFERTLEAEKPGIVYAARRNDVEELAAELRERGVAAGAYHGGMRTKDRDRAQGDFMEDRIEVLVATNAFGMGVDKPNVRFVFHHDVADSVDSHYQEVGRAGRDGRPARGILFYRPEDLGIRRFFAGGGKVGVDEIELVADAVARHRGSVEPTVLREETDLSESKLTTAVSRLEDAGALEVRADGEVAVTGRGDLSDEVVETAADAQEDREHFDRSRLEMMRAYAELDRGCRREFVLTYFGQAYEGPCGRCDHCEAGLLSAKGERPFPEMGRVVHAAWGEGVVQRYEDAQMVVLFDSVGYKTLGIDLVTEKGLLEAA